MRFENGNCNNDTGKVEGRCSVKIRRCPQAAAAYLLIIEKPANPFFLNGLDSEVLSVYTEEEYRGKGICTSLMKNMIEYAREHQICRVDLAATDEGYPIYKKLGFEDKAQKYTDMRLKLQNPRIANFYIV